MHCSLYLNSTDDCSIIEIQTTDDFKVEHQESFEVVLYVNEEEISHTTVWINDDDGNCFHLLINKKIILCY